MESKAEAIEVSPGNAGDLELGAKRREGQGEARAGPRRAPRGFERYVQPCLAELLGSALFIFTGCLAVIENTEGTGRLQPALAHGLALAIVIAVLGAISGGHFNPAVSLSVSFIGGLNLALLVPYILAQLCGGMIGAGLAKAISTPHSYANATGAAFSSVQADAQVWPAVLAEAVMTLFLTMVVCMGAVNSQTRGLLAPLCIGLTVVANILAGGAVSGACMNPARAFGPAVVANVWGYHWIYWVGPMAGALLTVGFVSGSHFNPPFTIAIYLCGGMKLNMVTPYVISQLIGGVLGAAMSKVMTTREKYAQATGAAFTVLQSEDQLGAAIFGEAAMTCLVTLVVLMGAVNCKSKSPLVPFLVGGAIVICVLAGGDVSGTCLNPARALGPAVITNYWAHHWVYWAGPTGGSLVAAAVVSSVCQAFCRQ